MPSKREHGWRSRVAGAWPYATVASSILFVSCALVGAFVTWRSGNSEALSYALVATDPALTVIAMLVVCLAQPDVFAGRRFHLPHLLTLPSLYVALLFGIKSLARNSESAIKRIEGAERFDLIWLDARVLVLAWLVLVLSLSCAGAFLKDKEGVN